MRRIFIASLASLGVACGGSSPTPRPAAPQQAPQVSVAPADDFRALRDAIVEVATAAADPDHSKLANALRLLSVELEPKHFAAARRIDELASRLTDSAPNEQHHADVVRDALSAALDVLADEMPTPRGAARSDIFVSARRRVAAVDPEQPLRTQLGAVTAALRSLANLVALDRGTELLFPPETDDELALGYDPAALQERASRASRLVLDLARESGWREASLKAAQALHAIADALEVSPLSLKPVAWRSAVIAVRYEALELHRIASISLDRSTHVKAGLAAATAALREALPERRDPLVDQLLTAADGAVTAIDARRHFVFQRAIIQESFRTLANALTTIANPRAERSSETTARAPARQLDAVE